MRNYFTRLYTHVAENYVLHRVSINILNERGICHRYTYLLEYQANLNYIFTAFALHKRKCYYPSKNSSLRRAIISYKLLLFNYSLPFY